MRCDPSFISSFSYLSTASSNGIFFDALSGIKELENQALALISPDADHFRARDRA
jgi:hypothetical protein